MSINHFSSDHLTQPHWWSHFSMDSPQSNPHPPNNPFLPPHHSTIPPFLLSPSMNAFDLNNDDDDETASVASVSASQPEEEVPKERLFEKPLTPSDVGKLNRLVIPKQHAEKHFPLNGGNDSGENGLLLGFEDELGKSWRFRYSYWNSSQSYVLTKGWSRFVKEKRLDAGDIVIFARHRVDSGRLFIGWRRRNSVGQDYVASPSGWGRVYYPAQSYQQIQQPPPVTLHAGGRSGVQNQQQTTSSGSGNSKMVRLFGVNLECHAAEDSSEPSTPVGSPISTHPHQQYYSPNHHMDISFSGGGADVYRQG